MNRCLSVNLRAVGQPDLRLFLCLTLYPRTPFLPRPPGLCLCGSLTWNVLRCLPSTSYRPGAALDSGNIRMNSLGPCLAPLRRLTRSHPSFKPVSDTTLCDPRASSIGTPWALVGNAESQAYTQTS